MTKQPDEWLDDVPDNQEEEDDEIIWVSKSEIKRDAEELKRLGAELVDLGKNALEKIPLDEELLAAVELAQRIKKEGRRRQLQLIGKMLRSRDVDPIRQALDKLKNRHNQQVALFHKLEALRDRLIEQGDEAMNEVITLYPHADRQQLRSMIRNAQKEKAGNKAPKSSRQIFQYLRELAESEATPRRASLPARTAVNGSCRECRRADAAGALEVDARPISPKVTYGTQARSLPSA